MTPLETFKKMEYKKPCILCDKSEKVRNVLFCKVSGKIILPIFYNTQVCHGDRLKKEAIK